VVAVTLRHLQSFLALLALAVLAGWNALVRASSGGVELPDDVPTDADASTDPAVVEHERGWIDYVRGFEAHIRRGVGNDPEAGEFRRGLAVWLRSRLLRGYTDGDHVYVCPNAPRTLRVHQAGHTPAFGAVFDPLAGDYRPDGGLPDEPPRTFDVMLPGDFPHTFLRLSDRRGLGETYDDWVREGKIHRISE
jgi:hypothetical protein